MVSRVRRYLVAGILVLGVAFWCWLLSVSSIGFGWPLVGPYLESWHFYLQAQQYPASTLEHQRYQAISLALLHGQHSYSFTTKSIPTLGGK